MAGVNSYVVHVLAFLAERKFADRATAPQWFNADQILAELVRRKKMSSPKSLFSLPEIMDLQDSLGTLVNVGILERWQSESSDREWLGWRLAEGIEPACTDAGELALDESLIRFVGTEGGGNVPPANPQLPGGDGNFPRGGRGLAEIVAHPVLFSLNNDDFDELLDAHLRSSTPPFVRKR